MKRVLVCSIVLLFLTFIVVRDDLCAETSISFTQQDIVTNRGSPVVDGLILPPLINVNSLIYQNAATVIRGSPVVNATIFSLRQESSETITFTMHVRCPGNSLTTDNFKLSVFLERHSIPQLE